jgi:tetratricopeptide (TPR) repeat protein
VSALVNKGYVCMQLNTFDGAIEPLSRAFALETNNYSALFDRAVCYLKSDKLDESRRDYETLQKTFPTAFQINYGLGEIAYRKKDTNSAIRNYELYLSNAPTNTPESKFIASRIKELKPASP